MAPCLVPSVLVWGREGGRRPASSLQGPSHCPPERAPPWTGKMAQRPQLPSQAGGRGGQAASCVLSPPAPQTPPPQLALWALRAAWQAALTVCPGCHWPSPQTPELGRALGAAGRPCPPSGPFLVLPAAVCPLLSVSGLSPARTSSLHRRRASACACVGLGGWRSHLRAHGGDRVCMMSLRVGQTWPGVFAACR